MGTGDVAGGAEEATTLARLQVAAVHLTRQTRRVTSTDLSEGQHRALASVVKFGPLSPSALADREGLHPAAVSRVLAHLESVGLIVREPEPDDGRRYLIHATPAGVDRLLALRAEGTEFLGRALQRLGAADVRRLLAAVPAMEALAAAGWAELDSPQPDVTFVPAAAPARG